MGGKGKRFNFADALRDIETALEPLTEGRGNLPDNVDQLALEDESFNVASGEPA